jgi:hypothetical protein
MRIPLALWALDQTSAKGNEESLRSSFKAWSKSDEASISRFQSWADDEYPKVHKAQMLHYHPFAALLILCLIGRYSDAAEPRQREMFSTLFEGGSATTLQNVLTAFDSKHLRQSRPLRRKRRSCWRAKSTASWYTGPR